MIVATIEISFSRGSAPDLIAHMVEDGRQYCFVSDCDLPAGCSADIEIVKPDGLFVIEHCTVNNNQIIAPIPEQATAVRGMAHYIIKVKQTDDAVIFSASGTIWIDDGLITDEMLESIAQVYDLKFPDDFLTSADLADYVTIQDLATALQPYALSSDIPEIEANPAGVATTDLNTLRINSDLFKIPEPLDIYSTTERIVGIWLDGSTLYEKTVRVTRYTQGESSFDHHIANIDKICQISGIVTYNTDTLPLPYFSTVSGYVIAVNCDRTRILLNIGTSFSIYNLNDLYVTIRYTKTSN